MIFEDCVQISDDDTVAETEENRRQSDQTNKNGFTKIRKLSTVIDTIVIDDECLSQRNNNYENNIIEINDMACIENNTKSHVTFFDKVYRENKILADFIEKCLDLENSEGMLRIINKNLIRAYKNLDENYKKSPEFKKVLNRAISALETDPGHKFSHVKNLCDTLKLHAKKRANLITLTTNLKENESNAMLKRRNGYFADRIVKRPKKDIIILDDDEQKDSKVINLDEYQSDVIVLDETVEIDWEKADKVEVIGEINEKDNKDVSRLLIDEAMDIYNEEKENGIVSIPLIAEAIEEMIEDESNSLIRFPITEPTERIDEENQNNIVNKENIEDNKLLVAQLEVPWEPSPDTSLCSANTSLPSTCSSSVVEMKVVPITFESDSLMIDNTYKIKAIEEEIALYKRVISELDVAEVCDDTMESPFIKSEKLKAKVVALYKELCTITGQLPVKRREVRLQVQNDHPSGPVRLLEAFINQNIGSDGVPPFPDFSDVVKCVIDANKADGLCWSKTLIMKEASALFTQCGRALQKQRQRREWRDLMYSVQLEALDGDPADEDPLLLAKLEENRRIALKKEHELIERYVMLDSRAPKTKPGRSSDKSQGDSRPTQGEHSKPTQGEHPVLTQGEPPTLTQGEHSTPTQDEHLVPIQGEYSIPTQDEHLVPTQGEHPEITKCIVHASATNSDIMPNHHDTVEITCTKTENIVNINLSQANSNLQDNVDSKILNNIISISNHCTDTNSQNHVHSNIGSTLHCRIRSNQDEVDSELQNYVNSKLQHNLELQHRKNINLQSNADSITRDPLNFIEQGHGESELQGSVNLNSKSHVLSNVKDAADSNFKSNENSRLQSDVDSNLETHKVKIKKEPIDIVALLNELGDNYSSSIIDIEDPFLVIDISSDSSDED